MNYKDAHFEKEPTKTTISSGDLSSDIMIQPSMKFEATKTGRAGGTCRRGVAQMGARSSRRS